MKLFAMALFIILVLFIAVDYQTGGSVMNQLLYSVSAFLHTLFARA